MYPPTHFVEERLILFEEPAEEQFRSTVLTQSGLTPCDFGGSTQSRLMLRKQVQIATEPAMVKLQSDLAIDLQRYHDDAVEAEIAAITRVTTMMGSLTSFMAARAASSGVSSRYFSRCFHHHDGVIDRGRSADGSRRPESDEIVRESRAPAVQANAWIVISGSRQSGMISTHQVLQRPSPPAQPPGRWKIVCPPARSIRDQAVRS